MRILISFIFTLILSSLVSLTVYGQTTLYSEDFSNDWKKGAITYGGVSPSQPTDGNWSYTNVGSPDNDGGSASSWNDMAFIDGAAVMSANGATSSTLAFRWNDVNNGSAANRVDWFSKSITGAYTTITASLAYAIGNGSSANSVWAYYQIDGGAWTLFGSSVNQSTASGTFTSGTLSCTSSIKIKVEALTRDANAAYVTIDDVQITGCVVVVPSVSITTTSNNICEGTSVTFTATPTNGGAVPSYQWKLNGSNVGTNSTTYTNATLVNGDIVSCVMTSNASCASPTTATSNSINMIVAANVTPSVSVSGNSTICSGTSVTFTATPTNGGAGPSYQWKLNGSNVGTNSTTYTNATLANGDIISCVMTSNASCVSPTTTTSNSITMTVTSVSVGGSITSNQNVYSDNSPNDIFLTGNNGSVVKWISSSDSLFTTTTDILITNTTLSSGNMGPINTTTYYRAIVKNGVCNQTNSSFVKMTIVSPLPIELIYFKPYLEDGIVKFKWVTASEQNNDYFTIEKSLDGTNFSIITKLPGAGNSSTMNTYTSVDRNPTLGISYYRLKQTDYNGRFERTDWYSVNIEKDINGLLIYPNPIGNKIHIECNSFIEKEDYLYIFDVSGKLIFTEKIILVHGDNSIVVELPDFSPGVYSAKLGTSHIKITK